MRFPILFAGLSFVVVIGASLAQAAPICSPKNTTARILGAPSPNAIHPDWGGSSSIGLGWSFAPKKMMTNGTGQYAFGDLYGPRGGIANKSVFVLLSEWACERMSEATAPSAVEDPPNIVAFSAEGLDGTWERMGNQCAASKHKGEGDYFRLSKSTYSPGNGSNCQNMSVKRKEETLDIEGHCTIHGHGVLIARNWSYQIHDGLLREITTNGAGARYERCEDIGAAFDQKIPFKFAATSLQGRRYVFTVTDWGKIEDLEQARETRQVIGKDEQGRTKFNIKAQRRVEHLMKVPLRPGVKFGYQLQIPPIDPDDHVDVDYYSVLENDNACAETSNGKDVNHLRFNAAMRGRWYIWTPPNASCFGGNRQVINVGGRNLVARTMQVLQ